MNQCKREWEVEAARDGRLTGNERLSLLRHIELCADCASEQQRLEALAVALRALPVSSADELSLRRQRHELLTRAHEAGGTKPAARSSALRATFVLLACACLVFGWICWPGQDEPAGPKLALTPSVGADYTRQSSDGSEVVELKHGRLTLNVRRVGSRRGVLVRTPDGEIEDIGTVFTVTVQAGRTEAISVSEGRVVARIIGKPEQRIMAGETHRPYAANAQAAHEAPSVVATATPARAHGPRPAREARQANDPSSASAPQHVAESEAAAQFSLAVAQVEAHQDARALVLLDQFVERFPGDARTEDAAFLRVVVRARGVDLGALRTAARGYLTKYPHGFRAPEVERVLRENGAHHAP